MYFVINDEVIFEQYQQMETNIWKTVSMFMVVISVMTCLSFHLITYKWYIFYTDRNSDGGVYGE